MQTSKIHFEVQRKSGERSDHLGSVQPPSNYPCFVLNFNYDWNDYEYFTWFALFYFTSPVECTLIGELKIMKDGEVNTYDVIPKSFERLDGSYCSLGMNVKFYKIMHDVFSKNECKKILDSLQDCTASIEQYEKFRDTYAFRNSLMRDLRSEKAFGQAKYIIDGRLMKDAFTIDYMFHPKYNRECEARFKLKFEAEPRFNYRCACIIGENGVGKTTMLSDLIECLITEKQEDFNGEFPLFSRVMSICTTPYDSFKSLQGIEATTLPYCYFCADQNRANTEDRVIEAIEVIKKRTLKTKSVFQMYNAFLRLVIPEIGTYALFQEQENGELTINRIELSDFVNHISSGQLQLLLLASFLYSKITLDALIVIDEPEVHLHPAAVQDLFALLLEILNQFDGYCIVATHSPLVVRELPGDCVYVMRRMNDVPEIGQIGMETLGCGLAELYSEVFGYDETNTFLGKSIRNLASTKSYDEILRRLTKNGDVGINTRFLVKRILSHVQHN